MIGNWFGRKTPAEEAPSQAPSGPAAGPEAGERKGLLARLKEGLARTRQGFVHQVDELLLGRKEIDPGLLDELEEILVTADMGVATVGKVLEELRIQVKRRELADAGALRERLQDRIRALLPPPGPGPAWAPAPFVVLVVGVNGVGKTTTIAKIARRLQAEGKKVLLVAADTFRAAAAEQLETWGRRLDVPVVRHAAGADPAAVVYDGLEAAIHRGADVVLVDTAGRLHTKTNLMEELKKLRRVIRKKVPEGPHEVFLVLDATTGQNAVSQARLFREAVDVTGIVLTKLDGTAKGGIVVAVSDEMGIPIRYIGIGEGMDDLRPFDPDAFVSALFEREGAA
ncbi:signal recognition particle-docking protein FtsY [Dissulfurirhabdus thermomarina]|uniref:Signal recognition particle receptor FtsY n=1 Tax=Dissulfurirhabdus thermomarina TaxID=1765737 RepID=A0A6N9TL13_DISTH|nr:signal recognition particle-docking protein FtsY [Dissulfurirhabdus thermomarina]NDY41972.1 signal recognition particle-docking protein FtsY [Dissulfurirhabdus thermomarina]NMX22805.1 signal recognition particle-docking protein FtsY [Dissulfurirhabdus thermomarina]